jgi:proline racemase
VLRFPKGIKAIDSHTEGEPTRVVTAGLPEVPGDTMLEKREWLRKNLDHVRTALIHEPRGHDAMVMAYLLPPVTKGATTGVVFTNSLGYLNMCGHGAIGVATVLVRMGMVPAEKPITRIVLDTPPGQVALDVHVKDGRPVAVTLENVPSFLLHRDVTVDVPGYGEHLVDVAYGGNWFALVNSAGRDLPALVPQNLGKLMRFTDALRTQLADMGIQGFDPETGIDQEVDHIEVFEHRDTDAPGPNTIATRTMTLCPGWAFDRSPCGTGTSAKLATLHARGELDAGGVLRNQSILGTEFEGRILRETRVRDHPAIVPSIRGSAWVIGEMEFILDPEDPLAHGLPLIGRGG